MWLQAFINIQLPFKNRMMDFCNKIVLITGAGSGIGEATAILLASHGAQLILVGRNPDKMHTVSSKCHRHKGKTPLILTANVTKEEDIKRIEKETINHFGRLDILLNIAGGVTPESILEPDLQMFDDNMNLNLRSVYMMITTFAPHLIRTKGNIVNISSIFSDVIITGQISYNIAKAGVEYLTKMSALELAPKGVRVNCIKPGYTKTTGTLNMLKTEGNTKNWTAIAKVIPLGSTVEAKEIAQAIAYLASDLSLHCTGTSIVVDGGQTLSGFSLLDKVRVAFE